MYPTEGKNKHGKKKNLGFDEAKLKAASFCAYQERYQQEVRDKLYSYGLHKDEVEELLSYLISEGFINEERYSKAFVRGRFRLKKWGKSKIINELKRKQISQYCINKGLEEIEDQDYQETVLQLIERKAQNLNSSDNFHLKQKIATYLVRKGFESELVWNILNHKFSG